MARGAALAAALLLLLAAPAQAFYLPGIAPVDYVRGQAIDVLANKLASPRSKLPYPYYSLPFCPVRDADSKPAPGRNVNLGQMLVGERALPTAFDVRMLTPVKCAVMCTVQLSEVSRRQFRDLRTRIRQDYSVRLNADNMPLITRGHTRAGVPAFRFGYKLGFMRKKPVNASSTARQKLLPDVFINNHLRLTVLYNNPVRRNSRLQAAAAAAREAAGIEPEPESYRVVGFEVQTLSVAPPDAAVPQSEGAQTCSPGLERVVSSRKPGAPAPKPQRVDRIETVTFSYSVVFKESDQMWATRWDPILTPNPQLKQIQWFSIINSLMIGLFLTGLVGAVLLRTVLRDFGRYKQLDDALGEDEAEEATGWKLVHGDVFRPPAHAPLLAICVGSGAQVLVMAFCTQILALLGFLSPANRGGLLSALLTLFVMASTVAGFVTSRVYMFMETSTARRAVTGGAAVLFPGISFGIFFLLNILVSFTGSSGSVGFGTLLLLLFMWFGMSLPLVFVGAFIGYRQKAADYPVRTNHIPRTIPPLSYYSRPSIYVLPAGVLPFGTVFMELVFLLNALNQGSVYYLYGALISVFGILLVTCAELSVVFTYLTLSAESWRWQWPAFMTTASSGVYVFLYALYYLFSQPPMHEGGEGAPLMSWVLYASYMLLVSGAFSLMCGSVGFAASQMFVRKIYDRIRVD